jgi:Mannosyl-glycoprotein endo-beta-N-acetylglucosaminidase
MPKTRNSGTTSAPIWAVFIIVAGLFTSLWLDRYNSMATRPYAWLLQAPQGYTLLGKPTLSPAFINQVLSHYSSPTAGKGRALYDEGVKYGIDPVYALAFFLHESTFGTTGVARFTLSLGNIRASQGYPQYRGYRRYRSWEAGFEDWYRLILRLYIRQWNLTTVDQIIPVYAPSSDGNDVYTYIQAVKNAVDTWRSGSIAM